MKLPSITRRPMLALACIMLANAALTIAAMRRTSTTFDEIVLMAGGARGYHTGLWDIAPEHPPFTQYLYGIPVFFAHPEYPDETRIAPAVKRMMGYRYAYAAEFFFKPGVDSQRLTFLGRLPAAMVALLLIGVTFFFARWAAGDRAAVIAALLVAFLPDVLAHGGVAYNDVPVTAAIFGAVWLIDVALRRPSWRNGIFAGLAIGLALGVKNSAVALCPIALVLIAVEAIRSRHSAEWRRAMPVAFACTLLGAYLALVMIYRGDFALREYQYALHFEFTHVTAGRVPSYFRGHVSTSGWWYFFPAAFLFKTSAGLHALMALGIATLGAAVYRAPQVLTTSRLRAPLFALLVYGALLLTSKLDIGFRYALPCIPFLLVLTAAGAARAWQATQNSRIRAGIVGACIWLVASVVSYYPNFLTYVSEYGPGRDENYRVFADSSLDWGQGLVQLHEFMQEHRIDRIYLSYFGSAWPSAYGIDYVPLASFYPLKPAPAPAAGTPKRADPEWVVISATNLTGTYFNGDPFARFRDATPDYVIGNNMYAYRISPDPAAPGK
jgi:4-amino-4-deoxy-L-arabinose transferase-like glycosyltransferase